MNAPSNKFRVQLFVGFEFTADEAAHILSDPSPAACLRDWVNCHTAAEPDYSGWCVTELTKGLGAHLAARRVAECRQLALSCDDPTPAPEQRDPIEAKYEHSQTL